VKLQRDVRDCPKCRAHRGFACHTSFDAMGSCPQLEQAPEPEPEAPLGIFDGLVNAFLLGGFGVKPDDET
jgi:hypothetical protein